MSARVQGPPEQGPVARFFAAFALSAGAALVVTGVAALLLGASIWSMLAVALVAAAFVSAAVTR